MTENEQKNHRYPVPSMLPYTQTKLKAIRTWTAVNFYATMIVVQREGVKTSMSRTHFGERSKQTALAQTGIADAYLASGWCVRCGCKRSAQGDCPNCDRWYTHPLLTIGGPLTLSLLILLLVGIRSLRDADPGFARFSNGLLHAAPMPAFIDPYPVRVSRNTTPVFFTPANPGVAPVVQPEESRLEKQLANMENLRNSVHMAERGYRTGVTPESTRKPLGVTAADEIQESRSLKSALIL